MDHEASHLVIRAAHLGFKHVPQFNLRTSSCSRQHGTAISNCEAPDLLSMTADCVNAMLGVHVPDLFKQHKTHKTERKKRKGKRKE
jgi:hypothetical protein